MINAYHPGNSEEIKMGNSFFGLSLVEENSHCRMKKRRVGLFWMVTVAALFLSGGKLCGGAAAAEPFRIQLVDQEKIGLMRFYSNPIRFDNQLTEIRRGCPLLGEDTREILEGLGYSA